MAGKVTLRFYEELNDFLPRERRKLSFAHPLHAGITAGDLIAGFGIPLDRVELVLVNGQSSLFSRPVQDADRISVYPVFESLDISPVLRVRPEALRRTRFLVGRGLKRLAEHLRRLGFEIRIEENLMLPELARIAESEGRILLTRNGAQLRDSGVSRGYHVKKTGTKQQVVEVLSRFDLHPAASPR